MKKILFGLFSVFICNVALADAKVVNDITDKTKIYWEAVDAAVTAFSSEETRAIMYAFFVEREGQELSAKDILGYCRTVEKNLVQCVDFVKKYVNYTGGDATDCTMASSIIGKDFSVDGYRINATTFSNAMTSCVQAEGGHTGLSGTGTVVDRYEFSSDSQFGTCFRFINNVKKCTRHLESYYTKELLKTDLDAKKRKQYSCILNLVQTGQLELPMNLMEKKCK